MLVVVEQVRQPHLQSVYQFHHLLVAASKIGKRLAFCVIGVTVESTCTLISTSFQLSETMEIIYHVSSVFLSCCFDCITANYRSIVCINIANIISRGGQHEVNSMWAASVRPKIVITVLGTTTNSDIS